MVQFRNHIWDEIPKADKTVLEVWQAPIWREFYSLYEWIQEHYRRVIRWTTTRIFWSIQLWHQFCRSIHWCSTWIYTLQWLLWEKTTWHLYRHNAESIPINERPEFEKIKSNKAWLLMPEMLTYSVLKMD